MGLSPLELELLFRRLRPLTVVTTVALTGVWGTLVAWAWTWAWAWAAWAARAAATAAIAEVTEDEATGVTAVPLGAVAGDGFVREGNVVITKMPHQERDRTRGQRPRTVVSLVLEYIEGLTAGNVGWTRTK